MQVVDIESKLDVLIEMYKEDRLLRMSPVTSTSNVALTGLSSTDGCPGARIGDMSSSPSLLDSSVILSDATIVTKVPPSSPGADSLLAPCTPSMRFPSKPPMLRNYSDLAMRIGKKRVTYKCGGSASSLLLSTTSAMDCWSGNGGGGGGGEGGGGGGRGSSSSDRATTPPIHSILKKTSASPTPLTLTPTEPVSPDPYMINQSTLLSADAKINDTRQVANGDTRFHVPRVVLESLIDDHEGAADDDDVFTFSRSSSTPYGHTGSGSSYSTTTNDSDTISNSRRTSSADDGSRSGDNGREADNNNLENYASIAQVRQTVEKLLSYNNRSSGDRLQQAIGQRSRQNNLTVANGTGRVEMCDEEGGGVLHTKPNRDAAELPRVTIENEMTDANSKERTCSSDSSVKNFQR